MLDAERPHESRRPELRGCEPVALFTVAKARQSWIFERVSEQERADALDMLVEELESYVSETFEGDLPELDITATDVSQTLGMYALDTSRHAIVSGDRTYSVDEELLRTHSFRGRLFRFYRSPENEVRVYVDTNEKEHTLPGGIYTPYTSVSLAEATIQLTDSVLSEQEQVNIHLVQELLRTQAPELTTLFSKVLAVAQERSTTVQKLQKLSPIVAQIERAGTQQLIDGVVARVEFLLKIAKNGPYTIEADRHRIALTERAYKQGGVGYFEGVEPRLWMMGDVASRRLGVYFEDVYAKRTANQPPQIIQIPVEYIKSIRPTGI